MFFDRYGNLHTFWRGAIVVVCLLAAGAALFVGLVYASLWVATDKGHFRVTHGGNVYDAVEYTAYDKNRIGIVTSDGHKLILRGDSTVEYNVKVEK